MDSNRREENSAASDPDGVAPETTFEEPDETDSKAAVEDADDGPITIPRVDPPAVDVPEIDPPAVDVPEVEIPTVETTGADAPSELRRGFWTVVLLTNVAVLFLGLAPMLLYFWRSAYHAGVLFVGGLAVLGLAYRRYRLVRAMDLDTWEDERPAEPDDDSSAVGR